MATLRVNKLEKVGKQSFTDGTFTIGRSLKNDMCLPHASVSRHHCVIEIGDEHVVTLRDLDSRHGTKLNGKPVTEATLHDGDVVGVGIFQIRYRDELAPRADGDDHEFDLEIGPDEDTTGEHALAGSDTGSVIALAPGTESPARDEARHAAELYELREQIDELKQQLAAKQREIDEAPAVAPDDADGAAHELAAARTELAQMRSELAEAKAETASDADAVRSELAQAKAEAESDAESLRAELAQARAEAESDVESLRAELEEARAELARRDETVEKQAAELAQANAETDAATASLRAELDEITRALDAETQSAGEHRARIADLESKLATQTAEALEQLKTFEHQRADFDERFKQRDAEAADLRRQAEKSAHELDLRNEKLDGALEKIAALKEEARLLKDRVAGLGEKGREVEQFLNTIRASARQVMTVLQQLATVRANVQTLENAYVQANEFADDAERYEADNHDEMVSQRDAVGEQLQAAHGQLDETINQLYQVTAQLTQYIVSEPVSATVETMTPAKRGFFSRLVRQ